MKETVTTFEVTLRRDVQQVTCVRVQARSSKEAIAVAESVADADAWNFETLIGSHRPEVKHIHEVPIRGRSTGKSDRRDGTDRRASRRRLDDKSRALVAARNKRSGS